MKQQEKKLNMENHKNENVCSLLGDSYSLILTFFCLSPQSSDIFNFASLIICLGLVLITAQYMVY